MDRLAYGVVQDSLVFIPIDEAEELASIRHALSGSSTWGEFKASVPSDAYAEVLELIDGDEPDVDAPFSADNIPGFSDGDWPAWPAQEMLYWVPKEIQEEFGRAEPSLFNGDCLTLDVDREAEIVAAFERNGYECRNDEVLVNRASAIWVPDDYEREPRRRVLDPKQPRLFVN